MRYKLGPFAVPHVAQQGHASEPEELDLGNVVGTDAAEGHDLFVDVRDDAGVHRMVERHSFLQCLWIIFLSCI